MTKIVPAATAASDADVIAASDPLLIEIGQPPAGAGNDGTSAHITEAAKLCRSQVDQTFRMVPLLVLFHAAAGFALHQTAAGRVDSFLLNGWVVAAVVVGLVSLAMRWHWLRAVNSAAPAAYLRLLEVLGIVFGMVWAVPGAYVPSLASASLTPPVIGLMFAIMNIGIFAFRRVPVAAIVLTGLLTAAVARSLFRDLEQGGAMIAIICVIYGLVMIGMLAATHQEFLRRAAAESVLRQQAQDIKLLLNDFERGTSDWLWETDADGKLTHASQRLVEVLGTSAEAIKGRTWAEILEHSPPEAGIFNLARAMTREAAIESIDLRVVVNGKPAFWQMAASPLRAADGSFLGFRGVGRDVTAVREAESGLQQAVQAAERASAAKSQFLAVMSHELRTPINAIIGFSELLGSQNDTSSFATRREYSQTILDSARHLQVLINDILDATRIEKDVLRLIEQDTDIGELIEVAVKMCREEAEKAGISIIARLTNDIIVHGDMTRLKQVVLNLLINALKFSPDGGVVNVDMQRDGAGHLVISIRDGGIGISPQDLARVFEPFVQAEQGSTRRFGGVGLGLSIAKRIAELHGGDIILESEPGAGTNAKLLIPSARIKWPSAAKDGKEAAA